LEISLYSAPRCLISIKEFPADLDVLLRLPSLPLQRTPPPPQKPLCSATLVSESNIVFPIRKFLWVSPPFLRAPPLFPVSFFFLERKVSFFLGSPSDPLFDALFLLSPPQPFSWGSEGRNAPSGSFFFSPPSELLFCPRMVSCSDPAQHYRLLSKEFFLTPLS